MAFHDTTISGTITASEEEIFMVSSRGPVPAENSVSKIESIADYLNGEITLIARRLGRTAPINTQLTALTRHAAHNKQHQARSASKNSAHS